LPDMEEKMAVTFNISQETKEQIDCLYNELNRPVSPDDFLALLVRAYYRANFEFPVGAESKLKIPGIEAKDTFLEQPPAEGQYIPPSPVARPSPAFQQTPPPPPVFEDPAFAAPLPQSQPPSLYATPEPESQVIMPSGLRELGRDKTDYRKPSTRLSGRPAYTKYGVFYSGVEPRVNP
jgi:hypothetical protein